MALLAPTSVGIVPLGWQPHPSLDTYDGRDFRGWSPEQLDTLLRLLDADWPGPLLVTGKGHTQLLMQLRDPRTQAEGYIHFCSLRGEPSPMNPQGCVD